MFGWLTGALRILGIPLLILGGCWLAAVIYYQQTGADVSSTDIVFWFLVVPAAAVASWFIGKALVSALKKPATAADTPAAEPTPVAAPADESRHLKLAILAAEAMSAAGDTAAGMVEAVRAGTPKPELSNEWVDAEGMPVKVAVCNGLGPEAHHAGVEEWLRAAHPEAAPDAAEGARLLALLEGPLRAITDTLASLPAPVPHAAPTQQEPPPRPVVTKVFAPAAWHDMVVAHVRAAVTASGAYSFGVVRPDAARPELQADALRLADAFCKASGEAYANSLLLIVACDTLASQAHIDRLEARSQLFCASNQAGLVPGEAAAAILAAPPALLTAEVPPLAMLHRASFGARQKPLDAGGRIEADHMKQLASTTLENAGCPSSDVAAYVSDCDHRAPWMLESAMLLGEAFPDLDPIADHLALCAAAGHAGVASSALALAAAAHAAALDDKPILTASVADSRARSVALLTPPAWQSSVPSSPASPDPS